MGAGATPDGEERLGCRPARRQGADGEWPAGRWTASTWTLLLLVALGLPEGHPAGRAPIERLLDKFVPEGANVESLLKRVDLCHLGFWLGLGAHFLEDDPRLPLLGEAVLTAQFEDGGWNCHMRNHPDTLHSSFHTTFNVLENLRIATRARIVPRRPFAAAERRAVELLLAHRLYRSDHTGAVISERFTQLTYPWHWHYTFLRGLDYLASHPRSPIGDSRIRSICCARSASRTDGGPSRSASPERFSSKWRSPAKTVDGTRYARSASSGSTKSPRPVCSRFRLGPWPARVCTNVP